ARPSTRSVPRSLVPAPRAGDDVADVGATRRPAQLFAGAGTGGHQHGRISRAARGFLETDLDTGDAAGGLDHLQHGETLTVAQIETVRTGMIPHEIDRRQVRARQVVDVHVVAHAGAVARGVVVAEH